MKQAASGPVAEGSFIARNMYIFMLLLLLLLSSSWAIQEWKKQWKF
jgi:hypothetical protein